MIKLVFYFITVSGVCNCSVTGSLTTGASTMVSVGYEGSKSNFTSRFSESAV